MAPKRLVVMGLCLFLFVLAALVLIPPDASASQRPLPENTFFSTSQNSNANTPMSMWFTLGRTGGDTGISSIGGEVSTSPGEELAETDNNNMVVEDEANQATTTTEPQEKGSETSTSPSDDPETSTMETSTDEDKSSTPPESTNQTKSEIIDSGTTSGNTDSPETALGEDTGVIEIFEGTSISIDLSTYLTGDSTTYTYTAVSNTGNVVATVSGWVMDITPQEGWTGEATITVTMANSDDSLDFNIRLLVKPVVHPPRVLKELGTIEFNQGDVYTLDMNEYFSSRNHDLSYTFSGAENLNMEMGVSGILTVSADWCWYGTEEIMVTASDEYCSIQSRMRVEVSPSWMPFKYPEIRMNPQEFTKDIPLSDIVAVDVEDVRVVSNHPMVTAEFVNGNIIITPHEGWTGEAMVEVSILSTSGQVGNMQIPVTVSERIRPVFAWLVNYILASMLAGMFIFTKMYRQSHAVKIHSPVELSSYRHYRNR